MQAISLLDSTSARTASAAPRFLPSDALRIHHRLRNRLRQRGQGMTEYVIIVALVAVAAIGIYTLLGQTIRNQTAGLAMEISGQDAQAAIGAAQGTATNAQGNANARKGLDNYNLTNRP